MYNWLTWHVGSSKKKSLLIGRCPFESHLYSRERPPPVIVTVTYHWPDLTRKSMNSCTVARLNKSLNSFYICIFSTPASSMALDRVYVLLTPTLTPLLYGNRVRPNNSVVQNTVILDEQNLTEIFSNFDLVWCISMLRSNGIIDINLNYMQENSITVTNNFYVLIH